MLVEARTAVLIEPTRILGRGWECPSAIESRRVPTELAAALLSGRLHAGHTATVN